MFDFKLLPSFRQLFPKLWRRKFPFGVDRLWRSWRKQVFPQIVEAGPPADLSEKETGRGAREFMADIP